MVQKTGQFMSAVEFTSLLITLQMDFPPVCFCWCVQQGQGGASSGVQSDAEPRQVRSRWAEQTNLLSISSIISPSPTNTQEEEEADLGTPARLDSAHGEEADRVRSPQGGRRDSFVHPAQKNTQNAGTNTLYPRAESSSNSRGGQ